MKGVSIQDFKIVELTNFLEKNQRLQHQFQAVILKITSYRIKHIFFNLKKLKMHYFTGETNNCLIPYPLALVQF